MFATLAQRVSAAMVRNRHRLPRFVNRLIDDVAKNPDGMLSRFVSLALGGRSAKSVPPPTVAPDTPIRVYIGPTNYSGQGHLWARALSADDGAIGAKNMAVELPGGFSFPADSLVPIAVYNTSSAWQRAELSAVETYSHVLIEAERPLFGSLFDRSVAREVGALRDRGISCAFLAHGTDIRSPRSHIALNRWSPFVDDPDQTRRLQADADANLELLQTQGLPVFVSTPDLLSDLPSATWCPVVVEAKRWEGGRPLFSKERPVVAHIPSMGAVKGTQLIEPFLRALHEEGMIDYRSVSGVSSAEMPALVGDADIVLDQFRLGSYGVAACEAMAAGRIVLGHVLPGVRRSIAELTGRELPIVEADPESVRDVLLALVGDRERAAELAAAGPDFVRLVHSGAMSSAALRRAWIDLS